MEHVDIINRIIEAEHDAQRVAAEAEQKRAALQSDLQDAKRRMRDEYFERARLRVERVRADEEKYVAQTLAELDRHFEEDSRTMEQMYADRFEEWAGRLLTLIVGHSI